MADFKVKNLDGLDVDYKTVEPNGYVKALNIIAEKLGGVNNLGVFADITAITPIEELKAEVADGFINVKTQANEKPGKTLFINRGIKDPYELTFDELLGLQTSK